MKRLSTILLFIVLVSPIGLLNALDAIKLTESQRALDFRVHECLKEEWPGICIRNRGLIIPGQSRFHRFVIYGGELNVNRRRTNSMPSDNSAHLNEDFLQILISSSTPLNTKDALGLTPLDYAGKNTNMYTILVRAGAKLSKDL